MNSQDPIVEKIKHILNAEIRPAIAMDGGEIEWVDYKDGVVSVRLRGACAGCPGAAMTLKMGVEKRLRAQIPEIREVRSV